MHRATTTLLVALAAGCACAHVPPRPPALCALERVPSAAAPGADTWIALVLRGYDTATRTVTTPALDCTGTQIRWEGPALACDDEALARTELPARPLSSEDVISTAASASMTLVWVVTRRYASGEALGPVALVEAVEGRLEVVAVGALRAYPRQARLRLEVLGDARVLVAEGETCTTADGATCTRSARVVPLRGDRFVPAPILGSEGQCLSPAWFELSRRERRRGRSGWELVELSATLGFGASGLSVEEQVAIRDLGDQSRASPARVLHRAQATRTVRMVDGRLIASEGPLWARLAQAGGP